MAIAFDAASTSSPSGSTWSLSHPCSGNQRCLLVFLSGPIGGTISAVTYNGVAMTFVAQSAALSGVRTAAYALAAPASGTNTLQVTLTGSAAGGIVALSFTGVDPSNPTDGSGTSNASGSAGAESLSFATAFAGSWVAAALTVVSGGASTSVTPGGGATARAAFFSDGNGDGLAGSSAGPASSGSQGVSWTWSGASFGQIAAVGLKAYVAPTSNALTFTSD